MIFQSQNGSVFFTLSDFSTAINKRGRGQLVIMISINNCASKCLSNSPKISSFKNISYNNGITIYIY